MKSLLFIAIFGSAAVITSIAVILENNAAAQQDTSSVPTLEKENNSDEMTDFQLRREVNEKAERNRFLADQYKATADRLESTNLQLRADLDKLRKDLQEEHQKHANDVQELNQKLDSANAKYNSLAATTFTLRLQEETLNYKGNPKSITRTWNVTENGPFENNLKLVGSDQDPNWKADNCGNSCDYYNCFRVSRNPPN